MPDLLLAAERTAKSVRAAFGAVLLVVCAVVPRRRPAPTFPSAAEAGAESPEAVSDDVLTEASAPASGHLTSVVPPTTENDPGFTAPLSPGSPHFEQLLADGLVRVGQLHAEIYVTAGGWMCQCGSRLPDDDPVLASHLRHVSQLQAAALPSVIGEALAKVALQTGFVGGIR